MCLLAAKKVIMHNNLAEIFSRLHDDDLFIIGETKFDSGVNFLNVLKVWKNTVTTKARLFFISFENHPISSVDLKRINFNFPNFAELSKQYYLLLPATHSLSFSHNAYLNLVIGDISNTLIQQSFYADKWFLNGFNQAQMWNKSIYLQIARLCKPKATFAAYTADPIIRKNLQSAGFYIKDFGGKEILYGYLAKFCKTNSKPPGLNLSIISTHYRKPWFERYTHHNNSHIIIIGGGISGAATAYSLAKRGYQVTVYEQNEQVGKNASGNYQAILYGSFSAHNSQIQELSFSGYRYSHHLIKQLLNVVQEEYGDCGLIQLGFNAKEIKSQLDLIKSSIPQDFCFQVNKHEMEQLAGICINYETGIYFPYGLWLQPQTLVEKLLDLPNIKIVLGHKIDDIVQDNKDWNLINNGKVIDKSSNVVLCNADSCDKFEVTKNLNLRKIRGQISIVKHTNTLTTQSKTILCGPGYITPPRIGCYTIGATFDFKNIHTEVTKEDHLQNLINASLVSDIFKKITLNDLTGQAAIRASTYDYMPLVGPIANHAQFKTVYTKLAKDKNIYLDNECPYYKGLYLNAAHGSKGILTAPISGEIIANYIDNTPMPCSEDLRTALHPNRLYVRELVKG